MRQEKPLVLHPEQQHEDQSDDRDEQYSKSPGHALAKGAVEQHDPANETGYTSHADKRGEED